MAAPLTEQVPLCLEVHCMAVTPGILLSVTCGMLSLANPVGPWQASSTFKAVKFESQTKELDQDRQRPNQRGWCIAMLTAVHACHMT